MSDEFDPYHKWLAIPPKLQPPNHYRLLGVELFESDLDVIDAAANQRMAYVQGLASGEHGDLSQKLLNELATARVCLTDPDEKSAYDATLKEQLEAAEEIRKEADRDGASEKRSSRQADEDASQPSDEEPTPPPVAIAPPKTEPQSSAEPPATHNAQTPPPPPPSKAVHREPAASELPAVDSGATAPPPVSATRQIATAVPVPVVESLDGKPASRAKQLRQNRGNPALVAAGSVIAVLILLGIVYVATGQWRKESEPKPSVSQKDPKPHRQPARSSNTRQPKQSAKSTLAKPEERPNAGLQTDELPDDFVASQPKLQNERPSDNGGLVAETKAAMERGDVEQALTHLEQVLRTGDTQERTWARTLREEIDTAFSDYKAQKRLEQLSGGQLEQLAEGKVKAEVQGDFSYPVLQQRFNETVMENVQAVLERRKTKRTEAKATMSDKPKPSDDAAARGEDMPAKTEPAPPKQTKDNPADLLEKRGLTRRGDYWVLEADDDLKELAAQFKHQEENYNGAGGTLRMIVAAVGNRQTELAMASNGQPAVFERARMAYNNARAQYHEVLLEYMKARSELTLAYLRAANRSEALLGKYHELANDPDVLTAFGKLEAASNKLGPTPVFRQNLERIRGHEDKLLNDKAPGFFGENEDDKGFHVDVIVNDRTSALFAYRPRARFNLVPEQVLREAGIEPDPDQTIDLTIGGVPIQTSKIVIPSLRIGKFVSRNVEAYMLPSNNYRFKGFLTDDAFPDFKIDVKPGENVATLRANR